MKRREFLRHLGLGLAAGWAWSRGSWPVPAWAGLGKVRLALLGDAHLKDGDDRRPEARSLARAVAEIRALSPEPDLVLFAGDLAHRGRPDALDLGREILSELPAPLWAVRGEGDCRPDHPAAWRRRFGETRFSRACRSTQVIGLDTSLNRTPRGPVFEIGAAQREWLARELAGLDAAAPLLILSHAPLDRLFYPWQQWTADAPELAPLLAAFRQVWCLHGHVHGTGLRAQQSGTNSKIPPIPPLAKGGMATSRFLAKGGWSESPPLEKGDLGGFSGDQGDCHNLGSCAWVTENGKPAIEPPITHYGLPATAWPRPRAVQGTPAVLRPGSGPRGCGWVVLTADAGSLRLQPQIWQG